MVEKRLDDIVKLLDHIRSQDYVAGLGAHMIDSQIVCEENGISPDYYMITMHHSKYWSAHPLENRVAYESIGGWQADHNILNNLPNRKRKWFSQSDHIQDCSSASIQHRDYDKGFINHYNITKKIIDPLRKQLKKLGNSQK